LSAFRGREALYPEPLQFGYIEENSDVAIFPNASTETKVAGIPLKLPILAGAFGSTMVGRLFWEGIAIGSAISGITVIVGENVCGMDPEAQFTNGKVTYSKELKQRVDLFRKFWDGKYGDIIVRNKAC